MKKSSELSGWRSQGQGSQHGRMNPRTKSEGYGDKVIQQLNNLRARNELCDFKVSAGEKSFQVHKAVLAATSDYFRVMFGGAMAESKQDSVDLKGVTADGLQMIIDFIYSGELPLQYDNLTEAINTASHLQVSAALDMCCEYIISLMTFENAQDFLTIANTYSLDRVLEHWDSMILANFCEFSETQCFLKLDATSLVKYLSSNALRASSEYKIFQCLDKWFKYNPARISNDCITVLTHVRFPLMSERELGLVQESDLMKRCLGALHLVTKGFKYHLDCREGHPVIEERSSVRSAVPTLVLVQPHNSTSYVPFQITSHDHVTGIFYRLFSDLNGSRDCRLTVIDNFIYICRVVDFGGGSLLSSLFRFDPRHLSGQELRPMRRLRMDFSLVAHGNCLYVFGGSTEQFTIMDSVECYNVETNSWVELPSLPVALHSLGALTVENKIYLSGGVSGQDRQPTNSFTLFHPHYRTYESLPGMFYARRLHEMVFFQKKVFVLGGIPRQGVPLHGQIPIECYDVSTTQWTMLSSTLSGRSVGHYLSFRGQILSLGHEHHNAKEDEIWTYDPALDDWTKYAKTPQRMSLMSAICSAIFVNYYDEKVAKTFLRDK
ncbi:kelch-like protein 26 isoform X1 [Saccostrea echinata]|uniref:kelch-like protein 26 isoform X1 n=1 Tax=Saccostrea echinata TaxID=191078 RepID=UPI002A81EE1C|nr:kelch-like protein 26 isoform X1 [Saccostrea echinata]XP_061165789.1 kelch-like protein 26 isoform X1 [Saccostrea echinata]